MRSLKQLFVGVAFLLVSGCGGQEEQVLNVFFTAIQGGDDNVIQSVSLAKFPGDVESWELVEIGAESRAPFTLPELHEKLTKKRSELRIETEKNSNFAGDNKSLFDEYQKRHAENPEQTFSGELGEFQVAWEERMQQMGVVEKELETLNEEAKALRSAAGLSLNTAVDEKFAGDVKGKLLQLKVHDGSAEKNYTFKLERYELVDKARNMSPIARWIITDIKEQA